MNKEQKWIAETVKEKRLSKNLTREQLSWEADVAPSTIRNLELNTHNITYVKLAKIVEALGMEIELMDIDDASSQID
jgi:transcriptional regulator with XRE-family HTH domain